MKFTGKAASSWRLNPGIDGRACAEGTTTFSAYAPYWVPTITRSPGLRSTPGPTASMVPAASIPSV